METSVTDIQQSINERLLKLRQLHDDPNSGISDTMRETLNKALYDQNLLQRSKGPIKAENIFPLTNELGKAADDFSHGNIAPWDPQHPFISTGQQLRGAAGAVSPFLAPVTAAADVLALPIRALGRPALETAQGLDPQLNFLEKSARSLTEDRDVGNVLARRTAADAPALYQKYLQQYPNETPQQLGDRVQSDLTRNWMIGGTAENVMNLIDPIALFKGMGKKTVTPTPSPKPTNILTPPEIPGMNDVLPPPTFDMVETMDGMQPVAKPPVAPVPQQPSAPTFITAGGTGQLGFRDILNKQTKGQAPVIPPSLGEWQGPVRDQGQQTFDFTQGPAEAPAKPEITPQPNVIQLSAQVQREIDGILRMPNGARPEAYRGLNRTQLEDLFTQRYNKPIQQLPPEEGLSDLRLQDNTAEAPTGDLVPEKTNLDKLNSVYDSAVNTVSEADKNPMYWENYHPKVKVAIEDLTDELFAAEKSGDKMTSDKIIKTLDKILDEEGNVRPGVTPEGALKTLKMTTALEDLGTIIKGIQPEGGLNMSMGVPRTKLTPEAQAAIQRWKEVHGPAIMAGLKASGKDAYSYFKEQFPTIPDEHLRAMADAVSEAAPIAAKAASEVPVTTKEGRGQYKGKVNLSVYSKPEVAGKIMDIVDKNPELASNLKLTDNDVDNLAEAISSGEQVKRVWKAIQESPTGQLAAEVRAEGTALASKIEGLLSTDFGQDVNKLKETMDATLAAQIKARTKVSSETGRALREFGMPVDAQKRIATQFEELLKKYKDDPNALQQLRKLRGVILDKEFNPSLWDKAYYIWINGLLSGPKTHLVNNMSNAIHMLNKFPDRALESIVDMGLSLKTGQRSTTMDEIPRMWKAMFSKNDLPAEYRYNAGIKTLEDSKNISPLQGKYSKKVEPLMYGTKLLAASDQFFGNKVAQMEHAALSGKQGLTDLDLKNLISDEAALRTLTRAPAKVTKVLLYAKQNLPGFRWIAPFIRTSADIIGQATEHTPLGIYGIVKSSKAGTLTQRELTQRVARLTKGTLLGVWAYKQYKDGKLVGDAPKTSKERQHFLEVQHKQENSVKIGNRWVPLSNIEPIGSVLSEFVNFYEGGANNYKDTKSVANAFMAGVMKAGVALGNKRYLSGVSNVMNAVADPERNAPKVIGQIAGGFIPGAVKTVTDTMDTKTRKATTIPEMIQRRVPGESSKLPTVPDIFGNPTEKPSGLNLFNVKDATLSKEDRVVQDTPMGKPLSTINGQKLTPKEYELLQVKAGQYKKDLIDRYADRLRSLPQDRKQYVVDQISTAANERARAEFIQRNRKYRPRPPFK